MLDQSIDQLAHALARVGTRRQATGVIGAALLGLAGNSGRVAQGESETSVLDKRRNRAERRSSRNRRKDGAGNRDTISRSCRRFVISAGPSPNDRFEHIDDDLLIELIPKSRNKSVQVILDDDNKSPNGPGGSHPKPPPFKAKVGDRVHIVARNEVAGGCELDEIWLHCTDAGGGKVKLTEAITPDECESDADRTGIFFETTVRIER